MLPDDGSFDAAFAFDILEHVADPYKALAALHRAVKPGGWIIAAMPFGPVEYAMWITNPERNREHVREWTPQDIKEIFGAQRDFGMAEIPYGPDHYLRQTLGHTVFWYRPFVNIGALGQIDWKRKLAQDPPLVPLPM